MTLQKMFLSTICALTLAGCGGGGGGGSGGSGGSGTNDDAAVSAMPTFALSTDSFREKYVAGSPQVVQINVKASKEYVGTVNFYIADDQPFFDYQMSTDVIGDRIRFTINAVTVTTLASGHYTGKFTVKACLDADCKVQAPGSPFPVPYDIEIVRPEGSTTAYDLKPLAPLSGASDWTTLQGNAAHTGYQPVVLDPAHFSLRWKLETAAQGGRQLGLTRLATGNGRIYFSSGPVLGDAVHNLTALNEADASVAWKHEFSGLAETNPSPPSYANGKVYAIAAEQQATSLFAFTAADGSALFSAPMRGASSPLAPTISNDTVYAAGGAGSGLYGFDANLGSETQFSQGVGDYPMWTPAVDSNYTYTHAAGILRIRNQRTGAQVSAINNLTVPSTGYSEESAPVIGAAGSVFAIDRGNPLVNSGGSIANFDTSGNTLRWTVKGLYGGDPAYQGGTLYATKLFPQELQAISESDGAVLWSWTPPEKQGLFLNNVLVVDNPVFCSSDSTTYAIDRTTHAMVWSYPAGGDLALSANGILYIQSHASIAAINLK